MFDDIPDLRAKLGRLFSANTIRFDELIAEVGLNPKLDLIGADLRGANFLDSEIDGWNLSKCDLTGASFEGARIRRLVTNDAIGVDLKGAIFLEDGEVGNEAPIGDVDLPLRISSRWS